MFKSLLLLILSLRASKTPGLLDKVLAGGVDELFTINLEFEKTPRDAKTQVSFIPYISMRNLHIKFSRRRKSKKMQIR